MIKSARFENREEAGRALAAQLVKYSRARNVIVLGFPMGGVAVGAAVAASLNLPLDILLVRKIHAPGLTGAVLGAITGRGVRVLDHAMIDRLHLSDWEVRAAVLKESLEVAWRGDLYRGNHPALQVANQTVILVDDGSTSCTTIIDAIRLLRKQRAGRIIAAVPAVDCNSASDFSLEADEMVAMAETSVSIPVSKYYKQDPMITDAEVRGLLTRLALKNCA